MQLLNRLLKILSGDSDTAINSDLSYNIIINNIAHIITMPLLLMFGIIALIKEQYSHSTILLVTSILVILSFYILNRNKNYKLSAYTITTVITLLLIYLLASGLNDGNGALWFYTYPMVCLFLLGLQAGTIYYIILFMISAFILFVPGIDAIQQNFTPAFKFRFILSNLAVFAITYIYEFLRTRIKSELEKSIIEARNQNKAKSEFISNLSFQLRTPLNSILGITSLLKDTNPGKNQSEYIETVETSANNLINVIKDIVGITRLNEKERFNELSFDLQDTIKNALVMFQQQHDEKEIKYNLSFSKFIPKKLVGIPLKVKQVFYNILETCLLSTSKNTLLLDVFINNKKETDVAIEVLFEIHTGSVNIPDDIINQQYENEKLFQYFNEKNLEEDDQPKKVYENEIIQKFNLSISQEIIELYGGKIGVSRKENDAVVFWFTMLFWKTKKENIEIEENLQIDKKAPSKTGVVVKKKLKNANVLIVEDNLINQKVLYLGLKDHVNSIEMANNGKEAVDMFSKSKYDIVLLDVQMPIMDGYKTTRKIRELETINNIHTPIIAMTAHAMDGDREKCLNEGMDEYISKPYQMDYLIKRMEHQLSDS